MATSKQISALMKTLAKYGGTLKDGKEACEAVDGIVSRNATPTEGPAEWGMDPLGAATFGIRDRSGRDRAASFLCDCAWGWSGVGSNEVAYACVDAVMNASEVAA